MGNPFSKIVMPGMEAWCVCGHRWAAGEDDESVSKCPACKKETGLTVDSLCEINVDSVLRNAREMAGYRCRDGKISV